MIYSTNEEIEAFRLERLTLAAEERETTIEELAQDNAPNTFGFHEAMHMASVYMDSVDRHIAEHPSVLADPDLYRLAHQAQEALYNLYQEMGSKHLR